MGIDFTPITNARPVNLAEIYGAANNVKSQQMQNQMMQQQMAQAKQSQAEQASLKAAFVVNPDGSLDENKTLANLYGIDGQKAMAFKQGLDQQKAAAAKAKNEETTTQLNNAEKIYNLVGESKKSVMANPTLDNAMFQTVKFGKITGQDVTEELKLLQSIGENPDALIKWAAGHALKADQLLPKTDKVDNGQQVVDRTIDPITGKPTVINKTQKMQSPDSMASNAVHRYGIDQTNNRADIANNLKMQENVLKQQENDVKRNEKIPQNSTDLRKEFDQLPEVKNYKQALPAYKAIEDAASRNTTASDINIVYGLAKLYDPNSVVREGEYATVANSPNIPDKVKGWAQYLSGGGRLTPAVKKQIIAEAQGRMGTFENEYVNSRNNYSDIAKRSQADPTLVFPNEYKSVINKPQQAQSNNEDAQAIAWAKANLKDPRAVKILKLHGM